ncbi:MAG: flagellar hook-associated protein FlgK [Deltaproteobacteria bacterium]|nr:flagellar hook-associated protein FlgK [Deltaproteobacteria bacterium]
MGAILGILDTSLKSLQSQQIALEVSSHNIANVNTPGYSKQSAVMETTNPASLGSVGQLGTGVMVSHIERTHDNFTTNQINLQEQYYGSATAKKATLTAAEMVFNESNGGGLGSAISDFFNAWESLAGRPESSAERTGVVQSANNLVSEFSRVYEHVSGVKDESDRSISSVVDQINDLSSEITDLNVQIQSIEAGGQHANDLRDKRDLLIQQISELVGVHSLEADDGLVSIVLPGGISLVQGISYNSLSVTNGSSGSVVNLVDSTGTVTDITSRISGGKLGGNIQARDDDIKSYLDTLNDLAARIVIEVNKVHYGGYGLDGSTGNLFFTQVPLTSSADSSNTGGASISTGTISDPTALTADDYEIRFTSSSAYDVVNTTTGTTVATGSGYTSGGNITDIPGITVVITDGGGAPAAGDIFSVGINKTGMAKGISVSSAVASSTDKIAAATEDPISVSGTGDNRNALAIGDLTDSDTMNAGTATFGEAYSFLVSDVGYASSQAEKDENLYDLSIQELTNLRDSVSGVSIDEESVNLIKYQNAYSAAARMFNVAKDLMDILVNLGR